MSASYDGSAGLDLAIAKFKATLKERGVFRDSSDFAALKILPDQEIFPAQKKPCPTGAVSDGKAFCAKIVL